MITKQNKITGITFWCEICKISFEEGWCRRNDKNKNVVEFAFLCEDCVQDDKINP